MCFNWFKKLYAPHRQVYLNKYHWQSKPKSVKTKPSCFIFCPSVSMSVFISRVNLQADDIFFAFCFLFLLVFFLCLYFSFVRHLFNAFFNAVLVEFWLQFFCSAFNCSRAHPFAHTSKGDFLFTFSPRLFLLLSCFFRLAATVG